ncbi:acylneuraminate cytidylyltransferase [Humibacter ginsenosidimutans]|uniref:N-acylneuraminate cytidylyltransferase n=1 Tax=Humibacter ginsenosidimutans TaxID=2599293 RepID=A0A5B8M625_9MICO|nr:acylneuraminate cytidylyltransferase [Humibacter ginsenosidimutans]QDZ14940.1 acylneuraminate cytidylyltransferase [Humibacter ginsenosidimutans]
MSTLERVVAVIPARAGSVGVRGKNLREVGGVPLVARAVASALAAASIDRVIVSTDGDEIAAVAEDAGAEVVRRPAALSTGTASSESAVTHALDVLAARGQVPEVVVFMQATSPFTRSEDLDAAVARVTGGENDVVFAAVETHAFLWRLGEHGDAEGVNHDPSYRPMRQDLQPQYQETGAFYVLDAAGFRRTGHRFFGRVGVAVIESSFDIDTEHDLRVADAIAHLQQPRPVASVAASSAGCDAIPAPRASVDHGADRSLLASSAFELEQEFGRELGDELAGLASVRAVVTDFDGVHTDDRVQVDQNGIESVTVNRRDGLGVRLLREAGIPVVILSTEANPVVGARGAKLGVEVLQGIDDKAAALGRWAADAGVPLADIAYLGNDLNDLGALRAVGWPFAVGDAHPAAMAASRHVLATPGGAGAVRELADLILEQHAPDQKAQS